VLLKLCHSLARVKIGGAAPSRDRNMVSRKVDLGGHDDTSRSHLVSGPKFTGLFPPNMGRITVD